MTEDPNSRNDGPPPQTEGMGFGLAVLAIIAATCGVIIWASVYL